jgi:hypothetical protein
MGAAHHDDGAAHALPAQLQLGLEVLQLQAHAAGVVVGEEIGVLFRQPIGGAAQHLHRLRPRNASRAIGVSMRRMAHFPAGAPFHD